MRGILKEALTDLLQVKYAGVHFLVWRLFERASGAVFLLKQKRTNSYSLLNISE